MPFERRSPAALGLLAPGLLAAGLLAIAIGPALAFEITVRAPHHAYRDTPISIVVPADSVPSGPTSGFAACQIDPAGPGKVRVTFMSGDLAKGGSRTLILARIGAEPRPAVEMKPAGANLDIFVYGRLFARYDTTTGPNKPYFYPVNGPNAGRIAALPGAQIVRHWPVQPVAGETHDHPHHRGLWFTHGSVNGFDFWTEGKGTGKTVHTGYRLVQSGPVAGTMVATADWIDPNGKKIADDVRRITVYPVPDGILMDFDVTVRAVGGPLVWGDTKEGSFGIRVADSMRTTLGKDVKGEGRTLNSNGDRDGAAWGKAADWCDYSGPVDGKTVGIAIFDHPTSFRHPTTWHVRDYGLFAANPFGLHDFVPADRANSHAGDWTTPDGGTISFRYRILFHRGGADDAHLEDAWNSYSDPPVVERLVK